MPIMLAKCAHCGYPVYLEPFPQSRWTHRDTLSVYCMRTGTKHGQAAEPFTGEDRPVEEAA